MRSFLLLALLISVITPPAPAADATHQAIVSNVDPWTGVWFPPGLPRSVALDVYKPEVARAFAADAKLAEEVCAWAAEVRVQQADRHSELRQELVSACREVTVSIEARHRAIDRAAGVGVRPPDSITDPEAQRSWQVSDWLTWRWHRELDTVSPLDPDTRRKSFEAIVASFSAKTFTPFTRFGQSIRLLALRPDDDRSAYWVAKAAPGVGAQKPPGIRTEEALGFLYERLSERAAGGDADWVRAVRNLAMYAGDYEAARAFAEKLVDSDASRPRDRIILALLQEEAGRSGELAKLQSSCPAPDLLYTQSHVTSSHPGQFCRDTAMEIAARLAELQGESTPKTVTQIATTGGTGGGATASTLKIQAGVLAEKSVLPQAPTMTALEQEIVADIEKGETYGHDWNPVKRLQEATRLEYDERFRKFEGRLFLIGLAPHSTRYVYLALDRLVRGAPEHDAKRAALRNVLKSRADAKIGSVMEWQRNVAAFDMYDGNFETALPAYRVVLEENRDSVQRVIDFDRASVAVLERAITGDDRKYRAFMANCPEGDAEYLKHFKEKPPQGSYCRWMVGDIASRIAEVLGVQTPRPIADIIFEIAAVEPYFDSRLRFARAIDASDPARGATIYQKLATDARGEANLDTRIRALKGMANSYGRLKKTAEAYVALQTALKELGYEPENMTAEDWLLLERMKPNGGPDEVASILSLRFSIAEKNEDFREMRASLDLLAARALRNFGGLDAIYESILLYASRLFRADRTADALRVIGYMKPHAKMREREITMWDLGAFIRAAGGIDKIPEQSTPWDAKDRPKNPVKDPLTRT